MDEIEYTYCNDNVASIKKYDFSLSEKENIDKVIENDKDVLYFDRRWLRNILGVNPDNIFFIYAPDDSMDSGKNTANDIKKGDILFIDISQKQGNDKVFVYKDDLDNIPSIREIKWSLSENIKLIPYNKKYKSEIVEKQVNEFMVNIIGRVIFNLTKTYL
jgi:phage repressor protein C with HTH and peptisase S24 domain